MVTAANGDRIFVHYTGVSPAPVADATGVGHLNDDLGFVIEGGTGRFAGAGGSGRLTATGPVYYDGRPTVVSSELRGTIVLPPGSAAAAAPSSSDAFLCYSDFQGDPGVWDARTAAALLAQGYWQPVAVAGSVDGGTNVGTAADPFHLTCNLGAGQTVTGQYTDASGDAVPPWRAPELGSYQIAK